MQNKFSVAKAYERKDYTRLKEFTLTNYTMQNI
jgi:hypothetical protein